MDINAPILKQIKESIQATDPGATVILYGSCARGDEREDSDIDILVLLDKEKITLQDRQRIAHPLYQISLQSDKDISAQFRSRSLWETQHRITPFYQNVAREGKYL